MKTPAEYLSSAYVMTGQHGGGYDDKLLLAAFTAAMADARRAALEEARSVASRHSWHASDAITALLDSPAVTKRGSVTQMDWGVRDTTKDGR